MNKKLFFLIIIIFSFLFLTGCFRIEPTKPDITPPTGVSVDISAALNGTNPVLKINWYLIPDNLSNLSEAGVNIYYVKKDDITINNENKAYNFLLQKWAEHIDESTNAINTSVEDCCIIKSNNKIPTALGSAAYSSLGELRTFSIKPSDVGGTSFANMTLYFIMTSWGRWDDDLKPVESPLSNITTAEIISK